MNNTVLIIGLIWPEPEATAAGTRMLQLIDFFLENKYELTFASTATRSDRSLNFKQLNIRTMDICLNDPSFDIWVKDLNPGIVIFDRFISEEQFGWRVQENCPNAIRILDTEDLHFLRKARETALKFLGSNYLPFIINDTTKREIASIYRCDLSLIISRFEENLLLEQFEIPSSLILYIPFMPEPVKQDDIALLPNFEERNHFMSIGNFKHLPNWDAVLYLKKQIWPLIRKALPEAELHIYGAYVTELARSLHNEKEGFLIKGYATEKVNAFASARMCLAPLRIGAGLKGKLIDAMRYGTPSITSSLGAEGMHESHSWNGFIADDIEVFAKKAVSLYSDKEAWLNAQITGLSILNTNFNKKEQHHIFSARLKSLKADLSTSRDQNFIGSMLWHHTLQSSKYLSKWIESKHMSTK